MKQKKLSIASFDFTCCEGCQLQLANNEAELPDFLALLDIRNFREISSVREHDYDIALIEGCITRSDEIERLERIRQQASIVVAFGTCACFGGVNALKNQHDTNSTISEVYGSQLSIETQPARRISDFVKVDLEIPGCPVSKKEVTRIIVGLVAGSVPPLPVYPVCVECKQQLNVCLFDRGELCLGSITRAGCDAVCPSGNSVCLGCRGPAADYNMAAFRTMVAERGFSDFELHEKLAFHNAFPLHKADDQA